MRITITEQEAKDIKLIRNYFGEHDKTCHEHLLFKVADNLVKKLNLADVSGSLLVDRSTNHMNYVETCYTCPHCKEDYLVRLTDEHCRGCGGKIHW